MWRREGTWVRMCAEGGWWGTPRDRLPLRFLIRCYRSRTSQHGLETDSQRFSVSFTMFCCYWRISFCLFVLQCHIMPCSRFNFLIEKNVLRMPFFCSCLFWVFFVFFLCDQFWLNVITALFQKGSRSMIPHASFSHVETRQLGSVWATASCFGKQTRGRDPQRGLVWMDSRPRAGGHPGVSEDQPVSGSFPCTC